MKKLRYYKREFLNLPGYEMGAFIYAEVEDTTDKKTDNDYVYHTDMYLTIADCSRNISLSFNTHPDDAANSLYKLNTLIRTLTDFRKAFVAEAKLSAERVRVLSKKKPTSSR